MRYFFIGVAGTGMSAIAQYLSGRGEQVSGSDRLFSKTDKSETQLQLERAGIECHFQDGSGITPDTEAVIVSTAIEESNVEYQKAKSLGIPVIKRSALLAQISDSIKTIAVGGTSGKSTTTAMIFHILQKCGKEPSLITGAGLATLQKQGLIGNAFNGSGEWLVIESDESDGSIVGYHPEIALLLNVERDHKEESELMELFSTFKSHTKKAFIVNSNYPITMSLSQNESYNFGTKGNPGIKGSGFEQDGFSIKFNVNGVPCSINAIGTHNMENALAAIAAAVQTGITVEQAVEAIKDFSGIYRRASLVRADQERHLYVVDDFAHNPSEVASAIKACQSITGKVIAYFQPHGFGPLRFMHKELGELVAATLRPNDIFVIGDVYYAGGTVNRDISPEIVSQAIQYLGKNAIFAKDKESCRAEILKNTPERDCTILIMGARDPKLSDYAQSFIL
ncbi:MAG: UDP-N-acetylmuramate--alanine ligase [Paludibacteraceae bacterium]|jgi:UDP-N-acetylmuramate--alanine ligase|nr:UDP-N-acetylmuramate--alanine ligase [Paludibacteraceae bacterium]